MTSPRSGMNTRCWDNRGDWLQTWAVERASRTKAIGSFGDISRWLLVDVAGLDDLPAAADDGADLWCAGGQARWTGESRIERPVAPRRRIDVGPGAPGRGGFGAVVES